ncbi:hypothetical protein [Paenibacillus rigui]|uniref:Uncharacterized protein n=1 Tax=Paenibacillus rigui TaxID=554312 RepID=A0A229UNN0_9BACL|nr:hypothetical protein [Paenibacillus rigui]OXM85036.1 hypothetical protein CF651_17620 [Paenibacillus rigui]
MKKTRYYPFERNRYFYGKLLTVRDFESEQKYFNDKRRMMNRLLHGVGVITGLQVIAVDDKSISVEMGAAIDALGREIIVPSPATFKLSMMEGFTNNEYAKNVYLCIAYDEKGKEPVHSVANASVRSDEISEYNRTLESYRLFIREEAPDPSSLPLGSLIEQTVVLYQDSSVRVLQITPKYVNPGQPFDMKIRIEKTLQAGKIRFDFEPAVERLELLDGAVVAFLEPQDTQETEYEFKVRLQADGAASTKATVQVKQGTGALYIGDKQIDVHSPESGIIQIMDGSVEEQWMDDYVKSSLDASLDAPSEPCIYLAKIGLLQMGPTYVIEKVEQVPFDEYVYNTSVHYRLHRAAAQRIAVKHVQSNPVLTLPDPDAEQEARVLEAAPIALPEAIAKVSDTIKSGVVDIPIIPFSSFSVPFGKATRNYVSSELEHGLGEGNVWIVTAVEESADDVLSDMLNTGDRVYFGAADVFKGSELEADLPELKIGTVVYPKKGTFRIGIRLQQATEATKVRIRWWACRTEQGSAAKGALDEALAMLSEAASGSDSM